MVSVTDIINMLQFVIDNICVMFGGRTNYVPLLDDLFLYQHEAGFIHGLVKESENNLARSFNFTFRYKDDVLSLNKSRFGDFVDRNFSIELEIKDTKDTDRTASYLDLHLEIDSEGR